MTKLFIVLFLSLLSSSLINLSMAFSVNPSMNARPTMQLFADVQDETMSSSEEQTRQAPPVKCPDCDLCDGSGRILGGLGAVLPWLPIKAYRPCPNLVERGGNYSRKGQGLDEIAFGRDSIFKSDS
jgi:hypothetical protein